MRRGASLLSERSESRISWSRRSQGKRAKDGTHRGAMSLLGRLVHLTHASVTCHNSVHPRADSAVEGIRARWTALRSRDERQAADWSGDRLAPTAPSASGWAESALGYAFRYFERF